MTAKGSAVTLTVPPFGPYALDHDEAACGDTTRELLSISEMRANISADDRS
jgi:hypothetical protein